MKSILNSIIIGLFATIASTELLAQPEQEPVKAGTYFGFGFKNQNFTELNAMLTSTGFSFFDPSINFYKTGILIGRKSKFVLEINAASMLQEKSNANGKMNSLSGFDIGIDLQRNILPFTRFRVFPVVGVGMAANTLYLTDQTTAGASFLSTLTNLQGQRTLYTNALGTLNLGMKANLGISKRLRGLNVSAQGGYKFQLNAAEWGTDGYLLSNSPKINVGGWYAEIGILLM